METNDASGGSCLIDAIADWLIEQGLQEDTILPSLLADTCMRLLAAGLPLARAQIGFQTLHPLLSAVTMVWTPQGGVETTPIRHGQAITGWEGSTYEFLVNNDIPYMRRRLTGAEALVDFRVLETLRDERKGTDYVAFFTPFQTRKKDERIPLGLAGSWLTDRPGGYTDPDIQALVRIQKRLALSCKVLMNRQMTKNVLRAYLGADAGARVLDGSIKRGDYENIHAVIWFSDMRGSTPLAEALSPTDFFAMVNQYFECTAGAVLDGGGEVLRFIGDAVLAIFPIGTGGKGAERACRLALKAAAEADRRIEAANTERVANLLPPIAYGLGLHVGNLFYGNIGVPSRLEFSVIGPAANEAARLEAQTKELGRRVVVSEDFARHVKLRWVPLGQVRLKGVGSARALFAPPP